jgi:hypothetical protein
MADLPASDAVARKTFYITLAFCLAFVASIFIFIL